MKPKELILKAFEGGRGDRIPVTLFGAGMWSINDFGTTFEALAHDPPKMTEMCVAESARIRSDVVNVGSGFNNFRASALGKAFEVGIKYREMGAPDLTSHFVNSEEDLAKLDIADAQLDNASVILPVSIKTTALKYQVSGFPGSSDNALKRRRSRTA